MKKEKTVKTHTRKTKSGKTVTVKQHTAKYDAADQARDIVKKAGAGAELEKVKKAKMQEDPYKDFDFTAEEFAEWYEGTGSKADKKVEKALRKTLGKKAYDELNDAAAEGYKKGGAAKFFTKEVVTGKSPGAMKETGNIRKSDFEKHEVVEIGASYSKSGKLSPRSKGETYFVRDGKVYESYGPTIREVDKEDLGSSKFQEIMDKAKRQKLAPSAMGKSSMGESKTPKEPKTPEKAGKSGNISLTAANRKEAERILRDPAYTVGFMKGKNGETVMTYSDESTGKKKLSAKAKKTREQWADETMQEFFGPKMTKESPKEPKSKKESDSKPEMVRIGGKNYEVVKPNSGYGVRGDFYVKGGKVYRFVRDKFREVGRDDIGSEAYDHIVGKATRGSKIYPKRTVEAANVTGKLKRKYSGKEALSVKKGLVEQGYKEAKFPGAFFLVKGSSIYQWSYNGNNSSLEKVSLENISEHPFARRYVGKLRELSKTSFSEKPQKSQPRKKRKNTPEEDAALDATLAEIRERNKQPYQVSRKP